MSRTASIARATARAGLIALVLACAARPARAASMIGDSLAPAVPDAGGWRESVWGEMRATWPAARRQDGSASGLASRLALMRLGYRAAWRRGPIGAAAGARIERAEIEDRSLGEVQVDAPDFLSALDFAWLEFRRPVWAVRLGIVPVPVGLANLDTDPLHALTSRPPEVERFVVPTVWSVPGLMLLGHSRGISWCTGVALGLDVAGMSVPEGLREARPRPETPAEHAAVVGRLDVDVRGLVLGFSGYRGDSWQLSGPAPIVGGALQAPITLIEEHATLRWRHLDARALYVAGTLGQAPRVSDALGLENGRRLGRQLFGGAVEAGDTIPFAWIRHTGTLEPALRYEEWDTQNDVAPPGFEDPAFHHTALTAALAISPIARFAVRADYEWRRNETRTETNRMNLSLAFGF
ncbi:MAG TPA: hypothetical protein VFK69_03610 [Candidatus Eisenbacteria bacterium]|nr:hypothetical protein [Candidatus Eisenbacteria bacterium]